MEKGIRTLNIQLLRLSRLPVASSPHKNGSLGLPPRRTLPNWRKCTCRFCYRRSDYSSEIFNFHPASWFKLAQWTIPLFPGYNKLLSTRFLVIRYFVVLQLVTNQNNYARNRLLGIGQTLL